MKKFTKKIRNKEVVINYFRCVFILMVCFADMNVFGQATWTDKTYNHDVTGIELNPMKGLIPGYSINSTAMPYSTDHFYIRLKDINTARGVYDWSLFESLLSSKGVGGRHVVARVWCFYPGSATGVPQYLINEGVTMYGECPDWNDTKLNQALKDFIAAFGARYDGDPRIVMIEAGLYGSWGEWNTVGSPSGVTQMSQTNMDNLLIAYDSAFNTTHIALRYGDKASTETLARTVGYYDDSFCYETLYTSWCFWPRIVTKGISDIWKTHPIGGEMRPEVQKYIFDSWPNPTSAGGYNIEDITACVTTTHASFVKAYYLWSTTPTSTELTNAKRMTKMMGYEFFVKSVKLTPNANGTVFVEANIQNTGVAPIYYNWQVEIGAKNTSTGAFTSIKTTNWNITDILPNAVDYYKSLTTNALADGSYKILMRFVNPLEALQGTAMILRFANTTQDADRNGWLTLGTATISGGSTVPVTGVSVSPTSLSLNVGQTSQLTETVLPTNATNKSVTWTSNNTSIATVSTSGLVTSVAAGSAVITVTTVDGGFTETCNVTVTTGSSNVSLIGSWVQGTTHAKETGSNRALVVMIYGEGSDNISASSVTYGGQTMTKVVEKAYLSGVYSYTGAFVLNEAAVAAATSGTIAVTWSSAPSTGSDVTSAFYSNVNQSTLTGASASNGLAGTTITTTSLANSSGDMVLVGGTAANNGTYTINNSFIRGISETSASFGDITSAYKSATGANETPSLTMSSSMRQTIVGFVLKTSADTQYTITSSAGSNGSISPSGAVVVNSGSNQSFTITPNSGYQVDVVTVDGVSQGTITSYTFSNVTANHTISATFKAITSGFDAFSQIEAESYSSMSGVQAETCSEGGQDLGWIENGDYIVFNNVDFGVGAASFDARVASNASGGSIEVRLGSPTGTLVGTCTVTNTGGWQTWTTRSCAISGASGTQNLYLVFKGGAGYLFNLNWIKFIPGSLPDVTALTSWVSGTTNNKVSGSERLMTVMVMGEHASSDFSATTVTYGGQAMTKVTEKILGSTYRTYAALFTLKEVGVNAATSGAINVTWSTTPNGFNVYSVLLANVDQTTPFAFANNALTGTSITTTSMNAASGDMVVMCGATENNTTSTFNNGFTKQFESNAAWGDGVGGNKMGTGVSETAKFTQSASGRIVLCAFVANKSFSGLKLASIVSNTGIDNSVGNIVNVYPNPVSKTLYINHADAQSMTNIKIFNLQGQLLYNKQASGSITAVDVNKFNCDGLILVQVSSEQNISTFKVFVAK